MDIKFNKTILKTFDWCLIDWTDLHAVYCFVEEFYHVNELNLTKKITFEVIRYLLEKKFLIAGYLLENNTFQPWNKSADKILQEIKQKWNNLNRELYPHEIVWFEITEKGKKEFERLNAMSELHDPIHYFRICEGGKKEAKKIFAKLTKEAFLLKDDKTNKIKVYESIDKRQLSYRECSKFGMSTIDVYFPEIKKYLQLKFEEK